MKELINKYFHDIDEAEGYIDQDSFSRPADNKAIINVESYLDIKLPQDFKDFLLISNGFEGMIGESYLKLAKTDEIIEFTDGYGGDHYPWIIYIGSDGGGEMFVLDKRESKMKYGMLPFIGDDNDFIFLGDTFEEFIKHLYFNDFWVTK